MWEVVGDWEEHKSSKLQINLNHKRKMKGERIEDTTGTNHEKHKKHESGGVESLIFVYFVPFVVML